MLHIKKKSKRRKATSSTTSARSKQFAEACALLVNSSLCTKLRNWATVRRNYALHISDYIIQDTKHSNKRHKRMRRQTCTKSRSTFFARSCPSTKKDKWLWMCAANTWCTDENHIRTRRQKKRTKSTAMTRHLIISCLWLYETIATQSWKRRNWTKITLQITDNLGMNARAPSVPTNIGKRARNN